MSVFLSERSIPYCIMYITSVASICFGVVEHSVGGCGAGDRNCDIFVLILESLNLEIGCLRINFSSTVSASWLC